MSILQEIKENKKVYPVYLLYGEEKFLLEGTLKQLVDILLNPATRDFNLTYFDETTAMRDILTQVEMLPTMSDWRVVVVKNPSCFKSGKTTVDASQILESALKFEDSDMHKCLSIILSYLGVDIEEAIYQAPEYTQVLNTFIEELGSKYTPSIAEFLNEIPTVASQFEGQGSSDANIDDNDMFLNWLSKRLPRKSVLILVAEESIDKRTKLYKQIEKVGKVQEFETADETKNANVRDELYNKIVAKFKSEGYDITNKAVFELRTRNNGNMHAIAECINKIIDFARNKKEISEQDVIRVVTQNRYNSIFDLTDAIGSKQTELALKSLYDVLITGEPAIKINALIIRQFRLSMQAKLLLLREDMMPVTKRTNYNSFNSRIFKPLSEKWISELPEAKELNVLKQHPFAAYKVFQTASVFEYKELHFALERVLEADKQLKLGQLEPDVVLEQLVVDLCE